MNPVVPVIKTAIELTISGSKLKAFLKNNEQEGKQFLDKLFPMLTNTDVIINNLSSAKNLSYAIPYESVYIPYCNI